MDQAQKIKEYYRECDKSYQHWGEEEVYNIHYGFWDKNTHSHIESLNNMNRVLAEKLRIEPGDKILDAGCGVGASSIWLAKNYDVEVVGITISELQCEKANNFAEKERVSNKVKFFVKNFIDTNFDKETFNIVWGLESICYALNKKDFIKEAGRVLKKGGKLIVADGFVKKDKLSKFEKFLLNNWIKKWAVPNLGKEQDFQRYLKEIGFKNVEFLDITKNILPSSREIFKRGILGWPIYRLKRKSSVQMDHIKGCIFQYLALKKAVWVYGIFYAEK